MRINKKNGERCLLKEGAVRVAPNWSALAKLHPVPLTLCENLLESDIPENNPFLKKNKNNMGHKENSSDAFSPQNEFEHLIPKNSKGTQ